MQNIYKRFYKNKVALNVLAKDITNAKEIMNATEGHAIVGVLSKNYDTVREAVRGMRQFDKEIDGAVSIGLGGGDNKQANVVANIAKEYTGSHINQVFPSVGATWANSGRKKCWINALVSPSGQPGYVNISTGPLSATHQKRAIVPVESAIQLVKDMGGSALKFFPMKGLVYKAEYEAVARICGEGQFPLEPTGGITLGNFEQIVSIALKNHVPYVIPHVYSSIIDQETGKTKIGEVEKLYGIVKKLVDL